MSDSDKILTEAKERYKSDGDVRNLLLFLHRNGFSQGLSTVFLISLGLGETNHCRDIVLASGFWSDQSQ